MLNHIKSTYANIEVIHMRNLLNKGNGLAILIDK